MGRYSPQTLPRINPAISLLVALLIYALNATIIYVYGVIRTEDGKIEKTVYTRPNTISEIINNKCKTPYTCKIMAVRVYINRAIVICSTQNLMKEEIKTITNLAEKAGNNNKIIKRLYEARIKKVK